MGFGGGPTYVNSRLIDWLFDLFAMRDRFAMFPWYAHNHFVFIP